MCVCSSDTLCPEMVRSYSNMHAQWELGNWSGTVEQVRERKHFVLHRTEALQATGELTTVGTLGFRFVKDWRERLDPAYQPKD